MKPKVVFQQVRFKIGKVSFDTRYNVLVNDKSILGMDANRGFINLPELKRLLDAVGVKYIQKDLED